MLNADRSIPFLSDEISGETVLANVAMGDGIGEIRFTEFGRECWRCVITITVKAVNIPHAYADLRFNPAFDKQTNYFTRSILCDPHHQQGW